MPRTNQTKRLRDKKWKVGDAVVKTSGDYHFHGDVVSCFTKKSGAVRVVVENVDGILHIFSPKQLESIHVDHADR